MWRALAAEGVETNVRPHKPGVCLINRDEYMWTDGNLRTYRAYNGNKTANKVNGVIFATIVGWAVRKDEGMFEKVARVSLRLAHLTWVPPPEEVPGGEAKRPLTRPWERRFCREAKAYYFKDIETDAWSWTCPAAAGLRCTGPAARWRPPRPGFSPRCS